MPVVSAWVMPWGIAGVVAMPLGVDGFCRRMMGHGIEWMIEVPGRPHQRRNAGSNPAGNL
jgi:hypothetical protein